LNEFFHPSGACAGSIGVTAFQSELTTPTQFGLKNLGVFTHCTGSPFWTKWKGAAILCGGNGWRCQNNSQRTQNNA
jgi:hypothetical protein